MNAPRLLAATFSLFLFLPAAPAQVPAPLPVLPDKPVMWVDAGGPAAALTSLAFAEDDILYGAGLDKVVRVWQPRQGDFVLRTTYRVPVGPGNAGAVNAVALSPNGAWVALAGRAPMRNEAGFRLDGILVDAEALSPEQNQDAGVIYVVSTTNPAAGKVLRGHRGEVRALAFAPGREGKPPLLVSAATERQGKVRQGALRLWDVEAGTLLAERTGLPATAVPPGLAVWHTGPEAKHIRVAVAWPDEEDAKQGTLRLWDAAPNSAPLQSWVSDRFTRTAVLVGRDQGATILTGGFGPDSGRLRRVSYSDARDTKASSEDEVSFPPVGGVQYLPVSLAVGRGRPDAAPEIAAVVLQPSADADFRLAVVDLREHRVVANFPLTGCDRGRLPVLAVGARHLAVAATPDHAVRIYALADLLAGRTEPKNILGGNGLTIRQVAFTNKGGQLWLTEDVRAQALVGGLLFDCDKGRVRRNDGAAPESDTPTLGDWKLDIDADRKGVTVRQGEKPALPIRLKGKDEFVTAAALRPARPGQAALLAVAYTERDASRTLILLCDPTDGTPLRLLVSHLQDVRGLAFSTMRPLLASVAEDQTVCVWGLTDLANGVGTVAGLGVAEESGKVVVRSLVPGSAAARSTLAVGDVLEKLGAPGGVARPIPDAAGFLLAVAARRPHDEIEVTVAGKGQVRLPVSRGTDERKPLFSLMLLPIKGQPEWIGWSPEGPYDYSDTAAEARVGWLTNTGNPTTPVSFVTAQQHAKEYYRKGILRYLTEDGKLAPALLRWKKDHPDPPPQAALRLERPEGAHPGERIDEYLAGQPIKTVRVGINDDYALDERHVLRWRLTREDGEDVAKGTKTLTGKTVWEDRQAHVDLSKLEWQRGAYRLRVSLSTGPEAREDEAEATLKVRFQPPAPILRVRREGKVVTTREKEPLAAEKKTLTLQLALEQPAGQEAEVSFARSLNGVPQADAPAARKQAGPGAFAADFALQEGLNRLEIRAVNQGALTGHLDVETAVAVVWVTFQPPKELPPRFTELRLDPEPEVKRIDGKEVWVVSRATARLTGKIEGNGILVLADWSVGGAARSILSPREERTTPFQADLKLKTDEKTEIRLRARSEHSSENIEVVRVLYQPPLPDIAFDPLPGADFLTAKVTLTGSLPEAAADAFTFTVRVISPAGEIRLVRPEADRARGTWKAELSLFPGANTIEGLVANQWRGERTLDTRLKLNYRRPPRITAHPESVDAVETNRVALEITVEGPAGRPVTAVKANGQAILFKSGPPRMNEDRAEWRVDLPEVFVNDGETKLETVSLTAITEEGESAAVVTKVVHKKIPRVPVVRFVAPAATDTTRRPEYLVRFRVESTLPLERVQIRGGETILYQADGTAAVREGALHVIEGETLLKLKKGPNVAELSAVNTDGRSLPAEVVVSYTPPAVLLELVRLETHGADGNVQQTFQPLAGPDGEVRFPPAPGSLVWLVGKVRWSDPEARALDDAKLEVVVRVGDCRQFPVALGPRGKGEAANVRPFRVPLVLIGTENRIKIDIPSVSQQELSRRDFTLACTAPTKHQRLHVLIIGVDVKDAARLKNRVLDALGVDGATRPSGGQGEFFKNPPFERCVLYRVLAGEVDRARVEGQLTEINNEILRLKEETGWLNDVVLIYYQGEDVEVPAKKERWLKTSRNRQFPRSELERFAIPCHDLPHVPGSQLLLLNVAGTPEGRIAGREWGGDPDTGLMRYVCKDPTEVRNADPALLGLLQEAMRKKGRLGDVVAFVNERLDRSPTQGGPSIVLDPDQAGRRFGEPER